MLAELLQSNNRLSESIPKSLGLLRANFYELYLDENLLTRSIRESLMKLTSPLIIKMS